MRKNDTTAGKKTYGISAVSYITFFVLLALCSYMIVITVTNRLNIERLQIEQLVVEKSLRINEVVSRLLFRTQVLSAMVVQEDGSIENFDKVAAAIADDPAILNVLIAPDGVVTHVYSRDEDQSSLIGLDFFSEATGNREAIMAVESRQLVMAGPFVGRQGQMILAGRLPVFLERPDINAGSAGGQEFWGIVSVTLRFPQALEGVGLDVFEAHGYAYELWRINPETGERQVIASDKKHTSLGNGSIEQPVELFNANWFFELSHLEPWHVRNSDSILLIIAGLMGSLLAAFVVQNNHTLKIAKKDLAEVAKKAENASLAKSMFLANMSHEIRTPLNGVIGFAELVLDDTTISEKTREQITKNLNSASSLLDIIDNILDISKIESGKMQLESIPFDLNGLLDKCKLIIEPKTNEKNLALFFHTGQFTDDILVGDPVKLRQILLNLLSNAVKFTDRGAVDVTVDMTEDGTGSVSVRFEVSDSGIGMNDTQLKRVFDSFTQADYGSTREYGGTGLGLAITKNFVEMMGGTLRAESNPNVGSKFSFTLRFDTAPAADFIADSKHSVVEITKFAGDVLVCEDNVINQEIIGKLLSIAGLKPFLAENGAVGLDMVRGRFEEEKPFDLILMDLHMPVMDGFSASREIIALGVKTPIVAVTADVTTDTGEKCKSIGLSELLSKPVMRGDLQACLMRYLTPVGHELITTDVHFSHSDDAKRDGVFIIDYEAGIENSAGSREIHENILMEFYDNQRNKFKQIAEAVGNKDYELAEEMVHKEGGVVAVIGATRLLAVLNDLEDALEDKADKKIDGLLKDYGEEQDIVLDHIKIRHR